MIKVAFWNINRKDLSASIGKLASEQDIDILVIAENGIEINRAIGEINKNCSRNFIGGFTPNDSLVILHRYPEKAVGIVRDSNHLSIRKFRPPLGPCFLLVAAHLPSRFHRDKDDLDHLASAFSGEIRKAQQKEDCQSVIVIGDLNMNPFDDGLCAATGFHAVMDKSIAREQSRVVNGKTYRYFYNPMWNGLGDDSQGPPGTYYYRGGVISHFWNTFDQVLISPDLLSYYDDGQKHVITRIGDRLLFENHRITKWHSDHLPVMISLNTDSEDQDND